MKADLLRVARGVVNKSTPTNARDTAAILRTEHSARIPQLVEHLAELMVEQYVRLACLRPARSLEGSDMLRSRIEVQCDFEAAGFTGIDARIASLLEAFESSAPTQRSTTADVHLLHRLHMLCRDRSAEFGGLPSPSVTTPAVAVARIRSVQAEMACGPSPEDVDRDRRAIVALLMALQRKCCADDDVLLLDSISARWRRMLGGGDLPRNVGEMRIAAWAVTRWSPQQRRALGIAATTLGMTHCDSRALRYAAPSRASPKGSSTFTAAAAATRSGRPVSSRPWSDVHLATILLVGVGRGLVDGGVGCEDFATTVAVLRARAREHETTAEQTLALIDEVPLAKTMKSNVPPAQRFFVRCALRRWECLGTIEGAVRTTTAGPGAVHEAQVNAEVSLALDLDG